VTGEKPRCTAIKAGGGRCSLPAQPRQDTCWSHSRETAGERRKNAAAGGKARSRRPPDELERAKTEIRAVTMGVLNGQVDRAIGGTVLHGFNVFLRSIEIQRKLDRQAELEDRIRMLEEELERRRRQGWPATTWTG
jgi:hypothetical protein